MPVLTMKKTDCSWWLHSSRFGCMVYGCYFEPVSECPTTLELIVPLNRAVGATCEASTTSKPATSMVV
jgi:hypothetical protein